MGGGQKKTGKGRLDKWYQLAKEQGYRARSAFKLVQLNRKYDFLANAKCVIDLCAAPGGWLQVAAKHMPQNSIIIGVDLVAIKPIPRCITLVEDITTEKCRRSIRAEIKDWKADVVLHDGAPNVGAAWVQDAFTQVELVLCSLKLATEFLAPGGTFCTKVFRSKDYNNLLWVFNQLFSKVEATKPPSSRNVSAEIFVVCTGYLAPAKIDPKLLNPKYVFKDLELAAAEEHNPITATERVNTKDTLTPATLNVFHPEKKRKQREGYADGDLTLHKECGVMDFIRSMDPIGVLGLVGRMRWVEDEDKKLFKHPFTSPDIKASVEDLKVLGKKDFKNLLKYRLSIREDLGLDVKVDEAEELTEKAEVEPLDEEEQIAEELDRLAKEDGLRRRRERRRLNERKTRDVQRMQLNMVTPMDMGLERQDGIDDKDMFDLGEVEGNKHHGGIQGGLVEASDSEGSDLDDETEKSAAARKKRVQLAEAGRAHAARRAGIAEVGEDDVLDPEEEEQRRLAELEAGLDAAYDMYHEHKAERDAKHKAKEERRKRDAAEGGEWHGIKAPDSDDDTDVDEDPAPQPSSDDDSDDEEPAVAANGMEIDNGEEEEDEDEDEGDEVTSKSGPQAKMSKRALKAQAEALKKQQVKDAKLITKLGPAAKPVADKSRAAAMWFDQPAFKGLPGLDKLMAGGDSDEEEEEDDEEEDDEREWAEPNSDDEAAEAEALKAFAEEEEEEEDDEDESDDDFTGAREEIEDASDMEDEADIKAQEDADELKARRIEELGLTTGQAMTLAQQLVNRERTKSQMIDEGFNRYTDQNGGDGLPSWFADDEQKHFRNNIPVTKEAVAAIREKMRALNARPIKKIAEAKARKKMRQIRRLDKVRQKAQGVNDDDDNGLTEKDKAAAIAKILSKGSGKGKPVKKDIKIVVGRGQNKGIKGRPNGVKGRYKMLDARDRKESRALKRIAKRDKKGGGRRKK